MPFPLFFFSQSVCVRVLPTRLRTVIIYLPFAMRNDDSVSHIIPFAVHTVQCTHYTFYLLIRTVLCWWTVHSHPLHASYTWVWHLALNPMSLLSFYVLFLFTFFRFLFVSFRFLWNAKTTPYTKVVLTTIVHTAGNYCSPTRQRQMYEIRWTLNTTKL